MPLRGSNNALVHVFLVSFPGQGHVNPLLRLGKLLASRGLLVTFSTPEVIGKEMRRANNIVEDQTIPIGDGFIRFEFFEDGWDWEVQGRNGKDLDFYLNHLELVGRQQLPLMIKRHEQQGRPVACLINNAFFPWVCDVAESLGILSATLWVQSCASFSAYYHYYHGLVPFLTEREPFRSVQLPCMPLLKYDEIPSFLHPHSPYSSLARAILCQFKNLSKPFCILLETFQELEDDLIHYMSKLCPLRSIGPLFKDPKIPYSTIRGDLIKDDKCIEWLNSKPPLSVVYISFGSVVYLKQAQVDEIAYSLLNSRLSFLWVIKPPTKEFAFEKVDLPDGFLKTVGDGGKVVQWCSQEQVLAHPSVACFMTHCGWNSTLEALANGVPVITFPQWGDQVTDAKYLVDEFQVGIRLCRGEAEDKIILRGQVQQSLYEATSSPKAAEMRQNALEWRKKAKEAMSEEGSSQKNLRAFVEDIVRRSAHINNP